MSLPVPGASLVSYTLKFWGTRGSIPTPGPQTARYGGNTACVSVSGPDGRLVILDAGSGLRPLGHELMAGPARAISADILLSHTHWDHIQGLPFFKPLSAPGNSFCIYGAAQEGVALEEILRRQMDPMVFPVPLTALAAAIRVNEITEGDVELADFVVRAFRLRHPGTTLGYRLAPAAGGRDIAYLTDNELGDGAGYPVRARLARAAGQVPRRHRYPDPRRDVRRADHPGALRLGTLDAAPGRRARGRGRMSAD